MTNHWSGAGKKTYVSGDKLGSMAKPLWRCAGCGLQHPATNYKGEREKPAACMKCGRMDFEYFDSKTEANRFATLLMLQSGGEISELRRQVPFPLNAVAANGLVTKVGDYVADYTYRDKKGQLIIEDRKGGNTIDRLADWKIRHMNAQGQTVLITKG